MLKRVTTSLLCSALLACASVERSAPPDFDALAAKGFVLAEPVDGIMNYEINGWQYVSPTSLIIPARPSQHYLLVLDRPCRELRHTEVIATSSTGSQLRAKFDHITVQTTPGMTERCFVRDIYRINKQSADEGE